MLTLTPRVPGSLTATPILARADENLFNVKNYGARGDDSTDDYAAVMAAVGALPAAGGTVYFPPGTYRFGTALSFTVNKPVTLRGAGKGSTKLKATFAAGDAISATSDVFSLESLQVIGAARNAGTYLVKISGSYAVVRNVHFNATPGGLLWLNNSLFAVVSDCTGDSNDTVSGHTCLKLQGASGTVTNCYFRTGPFSSGGYSTSKPCLWITGQTTSLEISNSAFCGGGPHSAYTISSIASDAVHFNVTTSTVHDFQVGDFIAVRGASVAAYNNAWRVSAVPNSTTVSVDSTLNPGAAAGGTAESLAACALISNEDGPVNESRISNTLFEGGQPQLYGSVSCYFDGRRGPVGGREISGWNLTGNYYDFGAVGLLLSGKALSVSNDPSVYGISVAGIKCESTRSSVQIEGAQGVAINGFVGNSNQTPTTDRICVDSAGTPVSAELYLNSGTAAPYTQGITVSGGNWGVNANWFPGHESRAKTYGLLTTGGGNIHELVITGATLYGHTAATGDDGTRGRWRIKNNVLHSATIGSNEMPSVASATTITLAVGYENFKITGTTDIQTINGGYAGREVNMLHTGALNYVTGGNIAILVNRAAVVGVISQLVYDGTNWYEK